MRTLTTDEIVAHIFSCMALLRWETFRSIASDLYGPRVRTLTVSHVDVVLSSQEYLNGPQLIATSEDGDILPLDPTTAWWQRTLSIRSERPDFAMTAHDRCLGMSLPEALRQATHDMIYERQQAQSAAFAQWSEHQVAVYDFAAPPPLLFPEADPSLTPTQWAEMADAWRARRQWERVRHYANTLYGPHATALLLSLRYEYNDSSYDETPDVRVRDAGNSYLAYDLSLPWWQERHPTAQEITAHEEEVFMERAKSDFDGAFDLSSNLISRAFADIQILQRDLLDVQFREVWGDQPRATYFEWNFMVMPPVAIEAVTVPDASS